MLSALIIILRMASRIACLVVVVSFALFVVNQTSSASTHQQRELSGTNGGPLAAPAPKSGHEGEARKTIDEVAQKLTSPFSAITAGSTSRWVVRGVGTLMALLVYGLGVGFLTRLLRLRA
jgi:hypothetical protein